MGSGATEGLIPNNGVWGYPTQTPDTFDQSTLIPAPNSTYLAGQIVDAADQRVLGKRLHVKLDVYGNIDDLVMIEE